MRRKATNRGSIIDLYCGCGGFTLGAALAGFRSLASIDIDPTLQSSYRKNFPGSRAIEASVADIDGSDWRHLIGDARPDGVVGGPPCQGFSWIGKRRQDDPRNTLVHHFYRHVDLLRPKFFIMENVEGLLFGENGQMLSDAIELVSPRYRIVGPLVVNAAHFGAATNRKRVIVIGYDPNEVDPIEESSIRTTAPARLATVREAICDLPSPMPARVSEVGFEWASYPGKSLANVSDYAQKLRSAPPSGVGWSEAVERHGAGYISGMVATRHSREVARRYAVIRGGKTDHITKSFRLEWDGQCPTLRAGTGADRGAFQAVRPLHPGKGRVITVREAARLQGFPDWFVFHPTKWHSFRMIGNSISPIVSQALIAMIGRKMSVTLGR